MTLRIRLEQFRFRRVEPASLTRTVVCRRKQKMQEGPPGRVCSNLMRVAETIAAENIVPVAPL